MKRALVLAVLLLGTASCRPMELYFVKPQGPPEYQLGWQDGCDTGISADAGYVAKMMYGFNKRPELGSSEEYKQGWNEGFTYCRFVSSKQSDSQMKPDISVRGTEGYGW